MYALLEMDGFEHSITIYVKKHIQCEDYRYTICQSSTIILYYV